MKMEATNIFSILFLIFLSCNCLSALEILNEEEVSSGDEDLGKEPKGNGCTESACQMPCIKNIIIFVGEDNKHNLSFVGDDFPSERGRPYPYSATGPRIRRRQW